MRILYFLLFNTLTISLFSQDYRIAIEGNFDDWISVPLLHNDPTGDDSFTNIDFSQIKVSHDENFIFFQFNIGTELNLQNINDITLYLDTDNNSNTGIDFHGVGAELVFNFGERDGTLVFDGNSFEIEHDNIGLITAPTVTGDNFEIAISRNIEIFGTNIFSANTIKIVLEDDVSNGDLLPNALGGLSYSFSNANIETVPEFEIKNDIPESFRVLSYNVLTDDIFVNSNQDEYNRIFDALAPQVIGFQEIYNNNSFQTAAKVEEFLPSTGDEEWFHAKVSPDIICVSRFPIKESITIDGSTGSQNNGAFLLEMPEPFNKELLLIVAHTPCCENNTGRQEEIDAIMAFIRDSKLGEGDLQLNTNTPIIIVGDMNLVGVAQNYNTFITGDIEFENQFGLDFNPDWDGTNLEDALPYTTNTPFSFTWFNNNSSFFPGRLDLILYSGSVLEKLNSFALHTPAMSSSQLTTYGLFSNDTPVASDHLPIVADFKLKDPVAIFDIETENSIISIQDIHPNPIEDFFSVDFHLEKKTALTISLINGSGKIVTRLFSGKKIAGNHQLSFNDLNLSKGIYFVRFEIENEAIISKKILHQ